MKNSAELAFVLGRMVEMRRLTSAARTSGDVLRTSERIAGKKFGVS